MELKCCVDSCMVKGNSWKIQLYLFPLDSTLHYRWVSAIKKYDQFEPNRNLRICSKHFKAKDQVKDSFGKFKLKPGAIPSIFVNYLRSLFKVISANVENYPTSVSEEMLSKKTLELLVHHGVFTDEDLEARLKREKFWDAYLESYYENERQQFQQKYNYLKKLYEDQQSSIIPELVSIQFNILQLK